MSKAFLMGIGGGDTGLPVEITTQAEMDAVLTNATTADVGKLYLYTGTTTTTGNIYENNTLYKVVGGGYSVTVTQSISGGAPASFYYSTDDGANWIILNAGTLTNITQIKFRIDGTPTFVDGYLQFNGNTIVTGVWRDTAYSANIIVTENSTAYCYAIS